MLDWKYLLDVRCTFKRQRFLIRRNVDGIAVMKICERLLGIRNYKLWFRIRREKACFIHPDLIHPNLLINPEISQFIMFSSPLNRMRPFGEIRTKKSMFGVVLYVIRGAESSGITL